ncbi:MAG: carboxypeptidase regulatory-like domain-containing protein [Terriglobales bacterium]
MEYDFRRKATSLFIGLLLILTSTLAFGQGIVTGSISGVVQDQQQAVVSGGKVTAKNSETNQEFTTETNSVGSFSLRGLPVGTYNVTIEAPKFQKLRLTNVPVTVARDSNIGIKTLTIGTEEVVNVESTPPLVETTTTQISTSFEARKVADLPIGNGFDLLALFTPGVVTAGSAGFSNSNGADVSANGQRGRSNNFMIDGQQNNDNSVAGPSIFLGNPDVIAEFQVITNYSAEYGRNVGSVINTITKSGTNAYHGTLSEYHFNQSVFDSFANQEKSEVFGFCPPGVTTDGPDGIPNSGDECDEPTIPRVINNRFGGTIGGPILKDKLWFFGSATWERLRAGGSIRNSGTSVTPTPTGLTQLAAAFPGNAGVAALQTIGPYSVTTGNPTPTNVFTANVTNGIVIAPVEFGTLNRAIPSASNDRQITGRIDVQMSSKDRLSGRYIIEDFITEAATGRFAAGAFVDVPGRTQQIALDWTRTWSSRFVSTFRFNYSRAGFGFEQGGFPTCTQGAILTCPTGVGPGGGIIEPGNPSPRTSLSFGMQNNLPQGRLLNNSQWQYNANWVKGRHTLKFGGEYVRQRSPAVFLPNILGTNSFPSFNSFLANTGATISLADGPPKFNFKEQDIAAYVQDEFKVKDNLTLIFGVRYEWFQQAINLLADQSLANQTGPNPFWDTSLDLSLTTLPRTPEDTNNWAPNIGFAWTPRFWQGLFGQDKTVIRGGFRITYDPAFYNIFLNVATAAPVVNAGTIACAANCLPTSGFTGNDVRALQLANLPTGGHPAGTGATPRNQTRVSDDFHNPYSQQWNFGVQRQITSKMAAEVRYVGNHTVGNFQTINANPQLSQLIANGFGSFIPSGITPCADPTAPGFASGRPNCNFTNVRLRDNTAYSIYHSMQSRFDVSNWHGLTLGAAWTWSKTIDNVSEIFSTASGGVTIASSQDPFDFTVAERGDSAVSFPHVLTVYYNYDLPFYKSQQGFLGHLLGGWSINSTYRYTSGQVWNPIMHNFATGNPLCQAANSQSFQNAFFNLFGIGRIDSCRMIQGSSSAPLDTVGQCTDSVLADCGLVDFYTGNPTSSDAVRWIVNDLEAAQFLGTPYGGSGRNIVRGDTINAVNLSVFKTTNITEKVKVRFEAQAYNILNRQFRGVPGTLPEFGNAANDGDFGNTFFNDSGGDSGNPTFSGIGRRRLLFGLKVIF